jgi:hypothetical protein
LATRYPASAKARCGRRSSRRVRLWEIALGRKLKHSYTAN